MTDVWVVDHHSGAYESYDRETVAICATLDLALEIVRRKTGEEPIYHKHERALFRGDHTEEWRVYIEGSDYDYIDYRAYSVTLVESADEVS